LTHQTVEADRNLLSHEPRLDLILGGHEHEAHDSVVSGRHVLKADANARSAQFATLWGGKGEWRQAVGLVPIDSRLPDDSTVAPVAAAWADSLRRRLGPERTLGTTAMPIDARDAVSRRQESPLGDLVADAVRAGTGADVALVNAGSMRLDDVIPPGPVTNYQLESIFLFADETRMMTFPLPAPRLREVLEHGVSAGSVGRGAFLQVSGVNFTYDPARPSGSRILGDIRRTGGDVLSADDTVTVALGVYPACEGGDGYQVPEAAGACGRRAAAPRAADLLIRYVTDSLDGRIQEPDSGRIATPKNTNPG
ncbi:MAG: 5'-nucleotidase C-terminal domain-containing protein, partial [Actinomycetota bacterium]